MYNPETDLFLSFGLKCCEWIVDANPTSYHNPNNDMLLFNDFDFFSIISGIDTTYYITKYVIDGVYFNDMLFIPYKESIPDFYNAFRLIEYY